MTTNRPSLSPAGFHRRIPLNPHQLTAEITPAPDVIVLCHLGVPQLAAAGWSLTIDGMAERPLTLSLADSMLRLNSPAIIGPGLSTLTPMPWRA